MRTFFQDAADGIRAQMESGSAEDLGELEFAHAGTGMIEVTAKNAARTRKTRPARIG
jgi:hypothetical protein